MIIHDCLERGEDDALDVVADVEFIPYAASRGVPEEYCSRFAGRVDANIRSVKTPDGAEVNVESHELDQLIERAFEHARAYA